ncbi:hypothetical protein GCM10027615_16860 [Plantactinospora veratri]
MGLGHAAHRGVHSDCGDRGTRVTTPTSVTDGSSPCPERIYIDRRRSVIGQKYPCRRRDLPMFNIITSSESVDFHSRRRRQVGLIRRWMGTINQPSPTVQGSSSYSPLRVRAFRMVLLTATRIDTYPAVWHPATADRGDCRSGVYD